MRAFAAILAACFLAPATVSSQEERKNRISWISTGYLARYFDRNPERKFALIYAYEREKPHFRFNDVAQPPDLVEASRSAWYFAYMMLDRDDPLKAKFRLAAGSPPTLIVTDRNLNELARTDKVDILTTRMLMAKADRELAAKLARTADDYKAVLRVIERGDRDAAIKALVNFYMTAPKGAAELDDCVAKLNELAKEDFASAELAASVGADQAMEFYKSMMATYQSSPPGVRAELQLARLEHAAGNLANALARSRKIYDQRNKYTNEEAKDAYRLSREIRNNNPGLSPAAAATAVPSAPVRERIAVPAGDALAESRKLVQELFKDDYRLRSRDDRLALARKLMTQGRATTTDAAAQYVLLTEASDVAARAGDPSLALQAIDMLLEFFKADGVALKTEALNTAKTSARTPDAARALAHGYLELVDEAVAANDFDAAYGAVTKASSAARLARDANLAAETKDLSKEIGDLRREYGKVRTDHARLKDDPDDAAANLDFGIFLCMVKGDWDAGLPHLAKGSDAGLKAAAAADLAAPTDPAAMAKVGDGWWGLAESERSSSRKANLMSRAEHWYAQAIPGMTGLAKLQVEKRMEEAGEAALKAAGGSSNINLLSWVDPKKHTIPQTVPYRVSGRSLLTGLNDGNLRYSGLQIPCVPPDEYDLTVTVERKTDDSAFHIGLVAGGKQFTVQLDYYGGRNVGLGWFNGYYGRYVDRRYPMAKLDWDGRVFAPGKALTVVCSVRRDYFQVTIDGQKYLEWKKPEYGAATALRYGDGITIPLKNGLFLMCRDTSVFEITRLTLKTYGGRARRAVVPNVISTFRRAGD